ncbi:uncharacterized protein LOC135384313 [Ornithodoros turicata]|uniref:uncharacterized protein LOC135384313 n=1 Tax=Ornithodoros turicata TaxID=34597 RepID=UPI003139D7A2
MWTWKQTDGPLPSGQLKILLSATDGSTGMTQVTHVDKLEEEVPRKVKRWRRKCGFKGFDTLQKCEQALRDLCGVSMAVFALLLSLLPDQRHRASDVTKEDRLVLRLMKLKLGIRLTALAALFGINKSTAAHVFRITLDHLSIKLEQWVFVPPRGTIKDTMPPCFTRNYPECTFVIDCTEVKTQTPSNPEQQHYLYSNYKGCYTLKWLVRIIPNGMIAFISDPYGGRHSDSYITTNSGFLTHVLPGDLILSDKGFPSIATTMKEHGAILVMPPFNRGGGQLSVEDMEPTLVIAQVRIHVERVIQRLKIYQVLSNCIPLSLIPHMYKVMKVCAALVNLQSPIIKTQ